MPRPAQAVPQAPTAGSTVRRSPAGPSWVRILIVGLVLWSATVLVTFATENSNLIPTIILLGSFLIPVTFDVVEKLSHRVSKKRPAPIKEEEPVI